MKTILDDCHCKKNSDKKIDPKDEKKSRVVTKSEVTDI